MSSSGKNEREVERCVMKDDTSGLEALAIDERRKIANNSENVFMKNRKIEAGILIVNWLLCQTCHVLFCHVISCHNFVFRLRFKP